MKSALEKKSDGMRKGTGTTILPNKIHSAEDGMCREGGSSELGRVPAVPALHGKCGCTGRQVPSTSWQHTSSKCRVRNESRRNVEVFGDVHNELGTHGGEVEG